MYSERDQAPFENRDDAGRQLADRVGEYKGQPVVVFAIPNGGVPVAIPVALALEAELDLVISRKIPLPLNPEAGFGAVADDGTVILNDELVARFALSQSQINAQIDRVRSEIRRRTLLYRGERPPTLVNGRTVIVIDDGLASGFTMIATVASVRRRRPKEIIVAVPAASATALEQVGEVADEVVTLAKGSGQRFAVADYYRHWNDLNDNEVLRYLKMWRQRRFESGIKPGGNKSPDLPG